MNKRFPPMAGIFYIQTYKPIPYMKNLFFIFLIFYSFAGFAQLPVLTTTSLENADNDPNFLKKGNYAQDTANEREQYVGTWEYNQDGVLFQVKIEEKDQFLNKLEYNGEVKDYTFSDVVTLKYRLVKNGVTIYNDLEQDIIPAGFFVSTALKKGGTDTMQGSFYDQTRNVGSSLIIKRLNTTPAKIEFNIVPNTYWLKFPPEYYNDGQPLFSVPTGEIEMVKID